MNRRPLRAFASGRFSLRYLAAALIFLSAVILSACGGGGKDGSTAKDEAPAGATAGATAEATAQATATGVTTGPAEAFAELKSYRVKMQLVMEGDATATPGAMALDLEGAYVAPDRSHLHVSAHLGELALEEESITVGAQSWVKTGDTWVEGEPKFQLKDLSPGSLLQELQPEQLRLLKPSKETVNGVNSLRYSIGRADVETLRSLGALFGQEGDLTNLPEEFNVDLWLAEDGGWPVRVTMTAHGATNAGGEMNLDFSLDVTNVNDSGVKVEPPA